MTSFPSTFPPGCPPADAAPATGTVYRLVAGNPPSLESFKTHAELGKAHRAELCIRCALSVFDSKGNAEHCQALFPYLGDHLAWGDLEPAHGALKETGRRHPGHHSWWVAAGVSPTAVLESVEALP